MLVVCPVSVWANTAHEDISNKFNIGCVFHGIGPEISISAIMQNMVLISGEKLFNRDVIKLIIAKLVGSFEGVTQNVCKCWKMGNRQEQFCVSFNWARLSIRVVILAFNMKYCNLQQLGK